MIYKLLFFSSLFFIITTTTAAKNSCYNCISKTFRDDYSKYFDVASSSKVFPLGRPDCSNDVAKKITCNGECVAIKIEKFQSSGYEVGYLHGCAEHVISRSNLEKNPTKNEQKFCEPEKKYPINYDVNIKLTYCRCQEKLCNDPQNDFVNQGMILFFCISMFSVKLIFCKNRSFLAHLRTEKIFVWNLGKNVFL